MQCNAETSKSVTNSNIFIIKHISSPDLTGQIPLPILSGKELTPPPNYDSLKQTDEDITEIVIADEQNSIPLLSKNGTRSQHNEANDT